MRKSEICFQALRAVTLLLCLTGFVLNSYETFNKYFKQATLVLSSTQHWKTELPLPVFVLCNISAFKETPANSSIWRASQYLDMTRNPKEILSNIHLYNPTSKSILLNPSSYTTEELRTVYFGRCLTIKLTNNVLKKLSFIVM